MIQPHESKKNNNWFGISWGGGGRNHLPHQLRLAMIEEMPQLEPNVVTVNAAVSHGFA